MKLTQTVIYILKRSLVKSEKMKNRIIKIFVAKTGTNYLIRNKKVVGGGSFGAEGGRHCGRRGGLARRTKNQFGESSGFT